MYIDRVPHAKLSMRQAINQFTLIFSAIHARHLVNLKIFKPCRSARDSVFFGFTYDKGICLVLHQASLWTGEDEFRFNLADHLFLDKSNDIELFLHLPAEACVSFISPTFQDGNRVELKRPSFL